MTATILSLPPYISMPAVLIGYSSACLGAGIICLTLIAARANWLERISAGTILATAFILGQGILASLWLLLALFSWFSIEVVGTLCLIFASTGLYTGRHLISSLKEQLRCIWHELRADTWGWQFLAGLTVALCLLWVTSLGRPLAGDGPAFYLAIAKLIAFSHRIIPMPGYERFTSIGLQGELHLAALMALHSPEAAKLFSWPTITAAGMMLASLGRLAGMGRRGQWLTLGILFSSSSAIYLSGWGKVDLFSAALGLAAYYWAIQIRLTPTKTPIMFLTGLLSGFAMVAKLSYVVVLIPTIALLVLWGYEPELKDKLQWRPVLKAFARGCIAILAGVILAFIPHFVKNSLLYHNPLAPIGLEGVKWLDQAWFGASVTQRIVLTYPLALTYGSYFGQGGNLSPLVLAFLPLGFYLPRPRRLLTSPLAVISMAGFVGLIAWILYSPSVFSPRYIFATLLLLVLLPARAAEYVSLNDHRPRLLGVAVIVASFISLSGVGLYFLGQVFFPQGTVQYLMRTMSECDRDGEYCRAMNKINRNAEPGDRVYLASYQHYWLRGDLLQCVNSANDHFSTTAKGEQFWLELYQNGFRYLLLDRATHGFVIDRLDLDHVPSWVQLQPMHDAKDLSVYQLEFNNPPTTIRPATCQRLPSSNIWEVIHP